MQLLSAAELLTELLPPFEQPLAAHWLQKRQHQVPETGDSSKFFGDCFLSLQKVVSKNNCLKKESNVNFQCFQCNIIACFVDILFFTHSTRKRKPSHMLAITKCKC